MSSEAASSAVASPTSTGTSPTSRRVSQHIRSASRTVRDSWSSLFSTNLMAPNGQSSTAPTAPAVNSPIGYTALTTITDNSNADALNTLRGPASQYFVPFSSSDAAQPPGQGYTFTDGPCKGQTAYMDPKYDPLGAWQAAPVYVPPPYNPHTARAPSPSIVFSFCTRWRDRWLEFTQLPIFVGDATEMIRPITWSGYVEPKYKRMAKNVKKGVKKMVKKLKEKKNKMGKKGKQVAAITGATEGKAGMELKEMGEVTASASAEVAEDMKGTALEIEGEEVNKATEINTFAKATKDKEAISKKATPRSFV